MVVGGGGVTGRVDMGVGRVVGLIRGWRLDGKRWGETLGEDSCDANSRSRSRSILLEE